MKKRNGFVSNSSSANFVVVWKSNEDFGDDLVLAIGCLFDFSGNKSWETDPGQFDDNELLKDARLILSRTRKIGKVYETIFFATMYNNINDFDPAAKSLLMALAIEAGPFELLYTRVENDN